MPMYPYYIQTQFGYDWPFDTETNVFPSLPPGVVTSLHIPSPLTIDAGRALVFNPVLDFETNGLILENGDVIGLDAIKDLIGTDISGLVNSNIPVFMGNPVYSNNLSNKTVHYIYIPSLNLAITITVALIVIFAIAIGLWFTAQVSEDIRLMHAMDLALESQREVRREYTDVDTGETQDEPFDEADIERVWYVNGDLHALALNQTGFDFLGASAVMEREGIDWAQLLADLEDRWATDIITLLIYAGIGIAGIYIAMKLIKSFGKEKQQPQYYYPPPYHPPPKTARQKTPPAHKTH